MDTREIFGTALNCMDGRCQKKALAYVEQATGVDYVDMITEPGFDKLLAGGPHAVVKSLFARRWLRTYVYDKAVISAKNHGSTTCFIFGHCKCAGNPGDLAMHIEHLRQAKRRVESWGLFKAVRICVFNEQWEVQEIT